MSEYNFAVNNDNHSFLGTNFTYLAARHPSNHGTTLLLAHQFRLIVRMPCQKRRSGQRWGEITTGASVADAPRPRHIGQDGKQQQSTYCTPALDENPIVRNMANPNGRWILCLTLHIWLCCLLLAFNVVSAKHTRQHFPGKAIPRGYGCMGLMGRERKCISIYNI